MKTTFRFINIFLLTTILISFSSCEDSVSPVAGINPFDNGGNERNMLVVISDIHLGADLNYAECKNNLGALEKFLYQVKASSNIKELIIAGDMFDEWFVPGNLDTYQGQDQNNFMKRIEAANKGVFDALNSIIKEGKILVTYTPGNHDISITRENVESVLPGINQARDNVQGLGTYTPGGSPEIAIEHGHRYNIFCAPDPISNQGVAPGTILPPGYFFTRIGALYVSQNRPSPGDTLPIVTPNTSGDASQDLLYRYWKIWYLTVKLFPIKNKFDEKIIQTNVNGFTGAYSVNDLVPYQSTPGGTINVKLYKGLLDNWDAIQTHNNVPVHIPASTAIDSVISNTWTDNQANIQYFMNPNSDKRIVIFGHTHIAKITAAQNYKGEKCIYANSGTWIDRNANGTIMDFLVITPQKADPTSETVVKLYKYENDIPTKLAEDSLRY